MRVLDLFSGCGGFSLGLERAGMETLAFCEFEPHAQAILKKHWPDVPIYNDVRELDGHQFRGSVDLVCGGFPCQDLSTAGKQAGFDGERSSLYREMLRIISECEPRWAIFENVTGLLTGDGGRWFSQFLNDLAKVGYDAEWHCIEAGYIGAPHRRDRVWVIAYRQGGDDRNSQQEQAERQEQEFGESACGDEVPANPDSIGAGDIWSRRTAYNELRHSQEKKQGRHNVEHGANGNLKVQIPANANAQRCQGFAKIANNLKQQVESMRGSEAVARRFHLSEPALCGADDGVSGRLDRLRRLGNAVVPQIPEAIGMAIMEVENAKA